MKMDQHITLAAALNIGSGALGVVIGLIILIAITGGGLLSQDAEAIAITSIVGPIIGGVIILLSLPEIIGGIGLLERRGWGRILVIIISCLNLIEIPFGTAIGIYSLWVLLHDETVQHFNEMQRTKTTTAQQ